MSRIENKKRLVRALAAFVVLLMVLQGEYAAYGVYAFNAFSRNDSAMGLHPKNTVQQNRERCCIWKFWCSLFSWHLH